MTGARGVFEQVLGADFARLAPAVQALHHAGGWYAGRVDVVPAVHPVARLMARVTALPRAMRDAPLQVGIARTAAGETWTRNFDGHVMRSRLSTHAGLLREWLGPVRFGFHLRVDDDGALLWRVARVDVLGLLPLPSRWFDAVHCREAATGARYTFEVDAAMPVIGRLVRYTGWLERG